MSADGRHRPVPDEPPHREDLGGPGGRFTVVLTRVTATLAFVTLIAAAVVPVVMLRESDASPAARPGRSGPPAVGAMQAAAATDQVRGRQWYLNALRVPKAWRWGKGEGVTVAVLDTGVDGRHRDLIGQVTNGPDYTGRTRRPGGRYWGGHGTAMAGIIAGHGNGPAASAGIMGIAPQAKILSIRVTWENDDPLRRSGALDGRNRDAVARGIRYAVDQGADIINMSLGGGRSYYNGSSSEEAAIKYALSKGVVLIASAGNDGTGANRKNFPAAYPGVIAVGAVDRRLQTWPETNRNSYVSVCAPGVDIISTAPGNRYVLGTGTSPSSAIVAGVAALIRSRYPQLTPEQVRQALIRGSIPRAGTGVCARSLDAVRAVYAAHQINKTAHGATPAPTGGATSTPAPAAEPASAEEPGVVLWSILGGGALLVVVGVVLGWRQRRRPEESGAEPSREPAMAVAGAAPPDAPARPAEPLAAGSPRPGRFALEPERPGRDGGHGTFGAPAEPPWATPAPASSPAEETGAAAGSLTRSSAQDPHPATGPSGNGGRHSPDLDDLRPFSPSGERTQPADSGDSPPFGTGLPPEPPGRGASFAALDEDPLSTGFSGRFGTRSGNGDPSASFAWEDWRNRPEEPAASDADAGPASHTPRAETTGSFRENSAASAPWEEKPSARSVRPDSPDPEERPAAPADLPQGDPGSRTAPIPKVDPQHLSWLPPDDDDSTGRPVPPEEEPTGALPTVSPSAADLLSAGRPVPLEDEPTSALPAVSLTEADAPVPLEEAATSALPVVSASASDAPVPLEEAATSTLPKVPPRAADPGEGDDPWRSSEDGERRPSWW